MPRKKAYQELRERLLRDFWGSDDARIGARLPTEEELEKRYAVSRTVVRESLATLAAEGWIRKKQGSGIYIAALTKPAETNSRRLLRIGFVAQTLRTPLAHRVIEGIESVARKRNCHLEVASSSWSYAEEKRQILRMKDDGVAGVIVYPTTIRSQQEEYLANEIRTYPIVVVDLYQDTMCRPHILLDNYAAGKAMTRHLLSTGRRRIVFLKYSDAVPYRSVDDRVNGYRRAIDEAGASELIMSFAGDSPGGERHIAALKAILALVPRPDALITPYDPYAEASIDYLRSHGVSVPGDIAVAGFDNLQDRPWAERFPSTAPDFVVMGERAMEMLLDNVASGSTTVMGVVLPCAITNIPGDT